MMATTTTIMIMMMMVVARGGIGANLALSPTSRAKGLPLAQRRAHVATKSQVVAGLLRDSVVLCCALG